MARIFISYRRDDSAGWAGRIYDRLSQHFGRDHIFMGIDTIEPGLDFVEVIQEAVGSCDVVIALIGPQWLASTHVAGSRRIDNPEDFVRLEIVTALARNIRVIPVLVQHAAMPHSTDLPDPLKPLAHRNTIEISDQRFHYDVGRLIEVLEKMLGSSQPTPVQPALKGPVTPSQPFEPQMILIPVGQFLKRHKVGGLVGCMTGVVMFMAGLFFTGPSAEHDQRLVEEAYGRLHAGHLEEAARRFQGLVGVRPAVAYEGLAAVALRQNELSKAASLCTDALRLDPRRAGCLLIQGDLYVLQNDLARAVEAYEAVLALSEATAGQKAMAYNRLGRLAAEQGQTDRAVAAYAKAQALDPQNWESLSNMGALLQQQGRFAEAVSFFNKAAALRPDDQLIQMLLHASQEAETLAKDRTRQERVDRLVEELTQRYRQGDFIRPQAEADEWTSRPLTLWFRGLERRGRVSFREGEDEFFLRKLSDVLEEQARVRLVERDILEKLLEELKLSTSALADPQTALRLGRLLSARLIATGSIATVGAEWQLMVRIVETETSAVSASIEQSFPLSQPIREGAEPVGKQLSEKLRRRYPLRARVLDVGNGEVTLNVGAVDGAVPGLRLQLFREDARGLREDVAEVELVEVEEKHSRAKLLHERIPAEVGLKARQLL